MQVYQYSNSTETWLQLGQDLNGEASSDFFGVSVDLSADGHALAVGAFLNDGSGVDSGHVRVYEYKHDAGQWLQLGQDVNGEAAGDRFGFSVALSANGGVVASGGFYNDANGIQSGQVRIFGSSVSLPSPP